jgi:PAS domain S-box-containing protein
MTRPLASLALPAAERSSARLGRLTHRSAALRSGAIAALTAGPMTVLFVAGFSSVGWASAFGLAGIVPIALAGFVFGTRGGLISALVVLTMQAELFVHHGRPLISVPHSARAIAFLLLGSLVGWQATQRRRAIETLARRNELSLEVVALVSPDGRFIDLNAEWSRLLGYSLEETRGRSIFDFIHPDDHEKSRSGQAATSAGEELVGFQNRYRHQDGSYRWLEWNVRADPNTGEKVAVARDISDRKRLEDVDARQKELLEQLIAERTAELEQRTEELHQARRENLQRLAIAAEYRDYQSEEHMARVGRLASLLAHELGCSAAFVTLISEAAPLHDIGKLGVPDTILLKPALLTPSERELMNQHTLIGAHILAASSAPDIQLAEEIAISHHEWWDGTGYPHRRAQHEIPLSGRIVSVADVFDALTHDRPYKDAWPLEHALAEIQALSGRQFDPDVVEALGRLDPLQLDELASSPLDQPNDDAGPASEPSEARAPEAMPVRKQLAQRAG